MSLGEFQRAFCDLIASPDRCLRWRSRPEEVLHEYDLSPREIRRLDGVVRQKGMSVNCTLYRVNRITPVYTLLPLTCILLGDDLLRVMERFWNLPGGSDLQFKSEIERFGEFLRTRPGGAEPQYLFEVLEFELAMSQLQFMPRRRVREELERALAGPLDAGLSLNPLVRVLRFQHDPLVMLQMLADQKTPPGDLPEGEFYLALDGRADELALTVLEPRVGQRLRELADGHDWPVTPSEAATLINTGFVVPSIRSAGELTPLLGIAGQPLAVSPSTTVTAV